MPEWREEQIGDATLYLGDCLEIMPTLGPVDAVVTDPPYGIGFKYESYDDTRESLERLISGVFQHNDLWERAVVFSGPTQIHKYPEPDWVCSITWDTTGSRGFCGFSQWTPVLFYGKDIGGGFKNINGMTKSDVIRFSGGAGVGFMRAEKIDHPCPKPYNIVRSVVSRFSIDNETILDPFMGSGTTGVACAKLGRKFIGIEIEEKYFDIACERIQKAYDQPDLFVPTPTKPVQGGAVIMTPELIKKRLSYDEETGVFIYKVGAGKRKAGDVAGYVKADGYRMIFLSGKWFYAHRLAWFLITGAWPKNEIDHIDGNRDNNRIKNIRAATRSENMRNCSSGNGWHWHKRAKRWQALIRVNGKRKYLGQFSDEQDAKAAYISAAKKHHGEFSRPPKKPEQVDIFKSEKA